MQQNQTVACHKKLFKVIIFFTVIILFYMLYNNYQKNKIWQSENVAECSFYNQIQTENVTECDGKCAEETYFKYTVKAESKCPNEVRIGSGGEGGWDMCAVPELLPKPPCLAYSFGIRTDWSFDDIMSTKYNCTVRAFDPSIPTKTYRRNPNLWFYQEGISGKDEVNKHNWTLSTFKTLRKRFNEEKTVIDYLKMDVDYFEWDVLEKAISDGSLLKIKQIGVEVHTREWQKISSSEAEYKRYMKILLGLESLGFKRWKWHLNPQSSSAKSPYTGKYNMCCTEFNYYNIYYATLPDQ